MKFLKYFFVALLSIVVTLIAVNQYVPVLIDVPKKDRLLVDFNFGKEITNLENQLIWKGNQLKLIDLETK